MNGSDRRRVLKDRRYKCDSVYRLAPKCPWRNVSKIESGSAAPEKGKARTLSCSAISMEAPISIQTADHSESPEDLSNHYQSLATAPDEG